jgi:hypothetical protein
MNYFKYFESFSKNTIPDDLIEWCIELYGVQPWQPYDVHKIPQHIIHETKKIVTDSTGGKIWRGFGLYDPISVENDNLNEDKTRTFKYDWGTSWTYNKDVAMTFAGGRVQEDQYGYLVEYDINKLSFPFSMCLIMNSCNYEHYVSEYEIVVIEEFKVPVENIILIATPDEE